MASSRNPVAFAELLRQAVNEPGIINPAYTAFHNYSFGNMLLAASQCVAREIPLGPLATFPRWKELGRYVKPGERAISLCQPVTIRRAAEDEGDPKRDGAAFTRFIHKAHWFVLSQTDGKDLSPTETPGWDRDRALVALDVTEVAFSRTDGNVMGFARKREIAISPLNPCPHKSLFHEIGHVVLLHTAEGQQTDGDLTPRSLREVEAEAVALLCCEALGLPGADLARGYIQHWGGAGNAISERSAQRILRAADQILRAGRPVEPVCA